MQVPRYMILDLENIVIEPTIYPRTHLDYRTTYTYFQSMLAGAKFPPIVVSELNGKLILIDGAHRMKAQALLAETKQIPARIEAEAIYVKSLDEAYLESVRRNITHGRPLSLYEKLTVYKTLREKGIGIGQISTLLQITPQKLSEFLEKRTRTTDSELTVLKTPLKNLPEDSIVTNEEQKTLGGIGQLGLITQLITVIKKGWLDLENKQVAEKLYELRELLRRL